MFLEARKKSGLSRVELAAKSHTFVYEIMNLEKGLSVPPNKLPAILKILNQYLAEDYQSTSIKPHKKGTHYA